MFDKLQTIETRYHELMGLLSDGAVQSDPNQYRRHSKALSEIQPIVERFRDYKTVAAEIGEARELAGGSDAELKELAEQELSEGCDSPAETFMLNTRSSRAADQDNLVCSSSLADRGGLQDVDTISH